MNIELIALYNVQLTSALGNDEFPALLTQLANDKRMKVAEMKELSKRFAGIGERTRIRALQRIDARHENLMGCAARARATNGRTAA